MKYLFAFIILFGSQVYGDTLISEMTQEDLKYFFSGYVRCPLAPTNDAARKGGKSVSALRAMSGQGDYVYFAEIQYPGDEEKTIYYMPFTQLMIGGYICAPARDYWLGFVISGAFNFLSQASGGTGTDISLTISESIVSSDEDFYNYCEF